MIQICRRPRRPTGRDYYQSLQCRTTHLSYCLGIGSRKANSSNNTKNSPRAKRARTRAESISFGGSDGRGWGDSGMVASPALSCWVLWASIKWYSGAREQPSRKNGKSTSKWKLRTVWLYRGVGRYRSGIDVLSKASLWAGSRTDSAQLP